MKGRGTSPHPIKAARPERRDSVLRSGLKIQTSGHRLAKAESLRCTPLPVYVGPRRSGQSLPPVPSAQVSAESAEPLGLVILAGSNLLRLHFRQRLPSAGPTYTCEGQSNCALFPGQCQSRKDRHPSHQRPCVRLLPRPTALPPMPFVSGHSHGYRRRCIRPQTAQAI